MKKYLFFVVMLISATFTFAQGPNFQTYTADLIVIATKGSKNIQWQNKDIRVSLNYKTGDFRAILNNHDFYNKQTNIKVSEQNISNNSEFIFTGNMPINEIINQKMINQNYDIELQLTNNDISLSETINFKMNIMRPTQSSSSYRIFTLTGVLYNDEINLPAFRGYDNQVEVHLIFNAFWTGQ